MRIPIIFLLLLLALVPSAAGGPAPARAAAKRPSPRDAMRALVIDISKYAKHRRPGFLVLPLNAEELVRRLPRSSDPHDAYLAAIDGLFVESLHFSPVDRPRDAAGSKRRIELLYAATKRGLPLFVIDYVQTPGNLATARRRAARHGHALFPANRRELDTIPEPLREAPGAAARTPAADGRRGEFLYLVNPGRFKSGSELAHAIADCPADLVVVDPWIGRKRLARDDVARMKRGPGGTRRPVIAYLSVGEAENYRTYWKKGWARRKPAWIEKANPDWPNCFVVRYWDPAWRALLFGSPSSGIDRILAQGFDGVALDTVDSYHWFEVK